MASSSLYYNVLEWNAKIARYKVLMFDNTI